MGTIITKNSYEKQVNKYGKDTKHNSSLRSAKGDTSSDSDDT